MSLAQRVTRLEKELEDRAHLPIMVWHEGRRDEALSRYLQEHSRKPEAEIEICFVAAKAEKL